jgi:hypothetical protein
MIRQHIKGVVAIITPFNDDTLHPEIEQLAHKMNIKSKDQLPGLFVIHGALKKMERLPADINPEDLNPELLLLWSRKALIEIEGPALIQYLKELEDNESVDVDLIEFYTKRLEESKKEHEYVLKGIEEVSMLVKEAKVNEMVERKKKE